MRRPGRFWATAAVVVLGGLGAVDLWANFNDTTGDTASEQFRFLGIPDAVLGIGLGAGAFGTFLHLKQRPHERP